MVALMGEMLQSYQINKRSMGLSDDTIDRVTLNTTMFIKDMNISRTGGITTDAIIGWGNTKLASGVAQSTLSTYYNSIRSFLVFLEQLGIEHSVDRGRIKCRAQYKQRVWLRPGEIRYIIRNASPQVGVLIRLLYTSGIRISEALSITSVHLDGGTTIYIKSKGGKMRPIFITQRLHDELSTLATLNGGFCFVDQFRQPLSRKKAYYYIKQAMIRSGHATAYPHALRHSFATELLRKGVSLSHTQRLMGHANVSITQIYEHLIVDDIEKAHLKLTRV